MTLQQFEDILFKDVPPVEMNDLLVALWWDAKNKWDKAHKIVQDINNADAAWVHAYLHRKEGDLSNAAYWYRIAGKPVSSSTLDEEWKELCEYFLKILT